MSVLEYVAGANSFVAMHKELLTFIIVPMLTWIVTSKSRTVSEKRAAAERELERELARASRELERELSRLLKLADFRQDWINGLRNDLAAMATISVNPADLNSISGREQNEAVARVMLRLNPTEVRTQELMTAINKLHETKQDDQGERQSKLVEKGQAYIKFEWDHLKSELRDIEKLGSL